MIFGDIELAIAEMEVVDSLVNQSLHLIDYALWRAKANLFPLAYGVSAVDAAPGATSLGLQAIHTTFLKITLVIYETSLGRGYSAQVEVVGKVTLEVIPNPIHQRRGVIKALSFCHLGQEKGQGIFSLPSDSQVEIAVIQNSPWHHGKACPTQDERGGGVGLKTIDDAL